MVELIVTLVLVVLGAIVFYVTGWLTAGINVLFRLAHQHHEKLRRDRRPLRIFLIRHGESQANVDKTLYASMPDCQIGLAESGQQQALAAGEKLRSIIGQESVYVYMSPYLRSKQTWENIKKSLSPSQIITERQDPRIREQEFGHLNNLQKLKDEFEEQKRFGYFFYRFSCGESGADLYDRASLFLDTLFREIDNGHHDKTQNIVIVSHGFFLRLFLMRYFRWNVEDLDNVKKFDNCEICQLTKENGVYILNENIKPPTKSS